MARKFRRVIAVSALVVSASSAEAQPPVRTGDTSRSVTLTLAEYNRLLDLAGRPVPEVPAPPAAAVVSTADLRLTVDRDNVRGRFQLAGNVLNGGVSRVPLVAGAMLIDANANGGPVPLVSDGGAVMALVPGPNPFALSLDWGSPLVFRPGRGSFVVPVPQAGSARASIDLPGEQADVRLSAGVITRRTVANGRTLVEATIDPGSATEVWWSMRDSAPIAAARDVRTLVEVMTLVTLNDADVRMVALIDVNVPQGELRTLSVRLPGGYELTGITGSSLLSSDPRDGEMVLTLADPAARNHQFLVNLERPHPGGSFALDTGLVSVADAQRERGEIAVEGAGTMELTADDRGGMHRIDVRELNRSLHSLARLPVLSAFRYQRPAGTAVPTLALGITRFADAGVLAAVAERAEATTMITSEGRALTEVRLFIQNRSQPFMKVTLPPGATIVSVDLAGQPAKPALGTDGTRVPLMRAGLRPSGSYEVSFVYLHAGTPFQRKGDIQMGLPQMDVPIGVLNWEVFVPERYSAKTIAGNAIMAHTFLVPEVRPITRSLESRKGISAGVAGGTVAPAPPVFLSISGRVRIFAALDALSGQIRGRVVDAAGGGALPGATLDLEVGNHRQSAISAADGTFVFSSAPQGQASIWATVAGFETQAATFVSDGRPLHFEFELGIGRMLETITVKGVTPGIDVQTAMGRSDREAVAPSPNVINLQQRASGVLPIRVEVPRAGVSHRFVRPLVVDDVTTVTLRYKRK